MRSRVASRETRTSPCLRRKLEISSAGDSAAITGVASSRKPAVTLPIARRVIVPKSPLLTKPSLCPAASPSAMWTLQGTGRVFCAAGLCSCLHVVQSIGGPGRAKSGQDPRNGRTEDDPSSDKRSAEARTRLEACYAANSSLKECALRPVPQTCNRTTPRGQLHLKTLWHRRPHRPADKGLIGDS